MLAMKLGKLFLLACLPLMLASVPDRRTHEVRIGSDLVVTAAVFGFVDPGTGDIIAADRIDTRLHTGFGWRVSLKGRERAVDYREEFSLPAPAQTWQVGAQTTVAPDFASAVTIGTVTLDRAMQVRNAWQHSPGDPKGRHTMRVLLDGTLVREFDFTLY